MLLSATYLWPPAQVITSDDESAAIKGYRTIVLLECQGDGAPRDEELEIKALALCALLTPRCLVVLLTRQIP